MGKSVVPFYERNPIHGSTKGHDRDTAFQLSLYDLFGGIHGVYRSSKGFANLDDMGVSKNRGTPKSSILIGFSMFNHPFWGTIILGNTHIIGSCYHLLP